MLRADVTGHFAGRPGVDVVITRWVRHLLDEGVYDDVHPGGLVLRLLAERAHPVIVFKVAAQTLLAEGVSTACGDRVLKYTHADGTYQMLLQ